MKREKAGRVVGCPYSASPSPAAERNRSSAIASRESSRRGRKYVETTLRDGAADGSIPVKDIPRTVEMVFNYVEGAMTTGRIQNSMRPIENMGFGAFKLMGLEWIWRRLAAAKR